MVACDGTDCPYEWFHYECVGLTEPPTGVWYCPDCISTGRNAGGGSSGGVRKKMKT